MPTHLNARCTRRRIEVANAWSRDLAVQHGLRLMDAAQVTVACASHVTRYTSHVTHHTLQVLSVRSQEFCTHGLKDCLHPFRSRSSHVARHASHVTRHTSHVTHHTSHFTHHTSHITHHTSTLLPCSSVCADPNDRRSRARMSRASRTRIPVPLSPSHLRCRGSSLGQTVMQLMLQQLCVT